MLREGDPGFDWKIYESKDDALTKDYRNQYDATVKVLADTTKVPLVNDVNTANTFTSQLASTVFGTGVTWDGLQFHMHAGSEHTINGKRYDLEMHTVHVKDGASTTEDAGNGFVAAAMGLIFDVDDYDKSVTDDQVRIIDTFFDSMKWGTTGEPVVDVVSYGAIMNMADFENRWIYKGSVTTPPCAENVYWNVLTTVYPIKQAHLDAFKTKLDEGTAGLAAKGNWRLIQDLKGQSPAMVKKGLASTLEDLAANPEKAGGLVAATVIFAVIAFFALIGCAVFGYQAHSKGESAPAEAKAADVEMAAAPAEEKAAE